MDFHSVRNAGGNYVFRHIAGGVCGGAVDFGGVFAGESAAAVPRKAAVGVHQYLAAGKPGVAHGAADYEAPGRVHFVYGLIVQNLRRDDNARGVFYQVFLDGFPLDVFVVLGAHNDGVDALGNAVFVLYGYLRFAVRTQVGQRVLGAEQRHLAAEFVGQRNGQGHEFGGFVAGEAHHHALVAGAHGR